MTPADHNGGGECDRNLSDVVPHGCTSEDLYKRGLQYSTGQGVPMDYVCAHMLFNLAAIMGNSEAKLTRKEISELMSTDEIALAQKGAREWMNSEGGKGAISGTGEAGSRKSA
jgi:hypothetical protein